MSDDRMCRCGHTAHWHGEGGEGDCEHDAACPCKAFRPAEGPRSPFAAIQAVLSAYRSTPASITEEQITAAWAALEELRRVHVRIAEASGMTDSGELGGDIAGPGGPFDFGGVVLDTSKAIIVDRQEVCKVEDADRLVFALLVEGRINKSTERARTMLLEGLDGLAALITEAHGVAERAGEAAELHKLCDERWARMPHPGASGA